MRLARPHRTAQDSSAATFARAQEEKAKAEAARVAKAREARADKAAWEAELKRLSAEAAKLAAALSEGEAFNAGSDGGSSGSDDSSDIEDIDNSGEDEDNDSVNTGSATDLERGPEKPLGTDEEVEDTADGHTASMEGTPSDMPSKTAIARLQEEFMFRAYMQVAEESVSVSVQE